MNCSPLSDRHNFQFEMVVPMVVEPPWVHEIAERMVPDFHLSSWAMIVSNSLAVPGNSGGALELFQGPSMAPIPIATGMISAITRSLM